MAPRSGLAVKNFIDVGAGVIDADYRGEVKVLLFNLDQEKDFAVKEGDRIAQLIIEKYTPTELVEETDLDDTARGAGGFGSTGVSANGKRTVDQMQAQVAAAAQQEAEEKKTE